MAGDRPTSFASHRAEYEARRTAGEHVVYASALHTPQLVAAIARYYREIAQDVDAVNVLNPLASAQALKRSREAFGARHDEASALLRDVARRIGEPTEGTTALDLAWIQGFTLAAGMSAFLELQGALSLASESLDRKAAYALACFSLYVATVSLVATVVLGLLSLR